MICLRCFVFSLPPCLFHRPAVPKVGFMEHQRSTIHDRHIRKIVFCINKNVPLYCVHYFHQQKLWYVCDTSSPPVMRSPIFPSGGNEPLLLLLHMQLCDWQARRNIRLSPRCEHKPVTLKYICRVFWSTAILKCMIVRKSIRRYKQGQWLLTATRFWFNSKIKKKAKMDYETPKLSVSLRDICKTTAALQSTE